MIKKVLPILLAGVTAFGLTGCELSSRAKEENYQEDLMMRSSDEVGMPDITEFYEKKLAKEIFELRDDSSLITYAYTKCEGSGKYTYLGKCMGYGLPYSTQYSCPDRWEGSGIVLPQADPNGLYSATGLSATWLYLINEKTGKPQITYAEPEIVVSQGKLPARICESWSLPADY